MPEAKAAGAFEQILAEHHEFRSINDSLRAFLDRPRPGLGAEGSHDWAAELAKRLAALHDRLVTHFRREEQDGLFTTLAARELGAARRIASLEGEHGAILDDLREALSETLRYSEGRAPKDSHLRRRVAALLDRLQAHEVAETDLMQRAGSLDLGAGD